MKSNRLLQLRKDKGKTIAEMAKDLDLSASAISNYERGLRSPDADALIAFAKYFDCSTDYILGITDFRNNDERDEIIEKHKSISDRLSSMLRTKYNKILSLIDELIFVDKLVGDKGIDQISELIKNIKVLYSIRMAYQESAQSVENIDLTQAKASFLYNLLMMQSIASECAEQMQVTINTITAESLDIAKTRTIASATNIGLNISDDVNKDYSKQLRELREWLNQEEGTPPPYCQRAKTTADDDNE